MGTTRRIAVSTTDGLTIYQHFGHTVSYRVFDITDEAYAFIEARTVVPPCDGGQHSTAKFDAVLELLSDCEAIVTAKIGPGAAEYLMEKGMRVFEGPGVLENVLGTIISKKLLQQ